MREPSTISLAGQTVINLAEHLSRLRGSASKLQDEFHASERGFFTPREDDAVVHLWISYHKARNALYDVLNEIRELAGKPSPSHLREFVVGFAAAIVLVDAARSLRDLFRDNEVVRRKLNESFPTYGIPSGSYDLIQLSLTDPSHAIGIRSAQSFYEQNSKSIHKLGEDDEIIAAVLKIIHSLFERSDVDTTTYVKARAADRGHQVNQGVRQTIASIIYAVQEIGSRLVSNISIAPSHTPQLPEEISNQLLEIIEPGDVFVTRKSNALTNYFLPGYWPHAAFYIGDHQVIEALKDGVRLRSMDSPLGNDAIAVVRPVVSKPTVDQAIQRAHTHVGKPYDFDFDFTRADRLVCTEVVYRSYEGLEGLTFELTRRAGRQTLAAEDLLRMAIQGQSFESVAVYSPDIDEHLHLGERTHEVFDKTMAPNNSTQP